MEVIGNIEEFGVVRLSKDFAQKQISDLVEIINQIPLVNYSSKEILAEKKGGRIFYGKWYHSLVLIDKNKPLGVIIGYERKSEKNDQYPENTIYISELGISKQYQKRGLGRKLVQIFLHYNQQIGFKHIKGTLNFSVQTNSAQFNQHVINLYKSLGFKERALKKYDNKVDLVFGLHPEKSCA